MRFSSFSDYRYFELLENPHGLGMKHVILFKVIEKFPFIISFYQVELEEYDYSLDTDLHILC